MLVNDGAHGAIDVVGLELSWGCDIRPPDSGEDEEEPGHERQFHYHPCNFPRLPHVSRQVAGVVMSVCCHLRGKVRAIRRRGGPPRPSSNPPAIDAL